MASSRCEIAENPSRVKLILAASRQDLLESWNGVVSELDLKFAGLVPSELVFPFVQEQQNWKERKRYYDNSSGQGYWQNLYVQDEHKNSDGVKQSNCTTKFRQRQQWTEASTWDQFDGSMWTSKQLQLALQTRWQGAKGQDQRRTTCTGIIQCDATVGNNRSSAMIVGDTWIGKWRTWLSMASSTLLERISCRRWTALCMKMQSEANIADDGDVVGRLNRNMHGFRDVSNAWVWDWAEPSSITGSRIGTNKSSIVLS